MRLISGGHTLTKKQFNSGSINLALAIFWGCLIGYLVGNENYVFLGVMTFVVFLILAPFYLNLNILIYLLVISVPFFNFEFFSLDKIVGSLGNVPVHLTHILTVMLILIFVLQTMLKTGSFKIDATGKAILLLALVHLISIIGIFQVYNDFTEYFKSLTFMLLFTMLYFAFVNSINHQEILIKIIKVWIVTSLVISLYGLYQFLTGFLDFLPVIPGTELKMYYGFPRVYSMMREPAEFVAYSIYPLILMFMFVIGKQRFPFKTQTKNLFALLIMLIAFLLSFSITGYAYLFFFLFLFILGRFFRADMRKLRLPFLTALVILIGFFVTDVGQRFQSRFILVFKLAEGSSLERLNSISIAWQEFIAHPIIGIGPGNFKSHSLPGMFLPERYGHKPGYADSAFFNNLAELGIIGIVAIFSLFVTLIASLRKVIKLNRANDLSLHISRGLYFVFLVYVFSFIPAGGWFNFWVWVNISVISTWVLLENKRLKKAEKCIHN